MLKSTTYDKLKLVSLFFGYLATFVLTLTDIWGFQYGAEIAATVSAFGVLLGAVLTASSKQYHAALMEDGAADYTEPEYQITEEQIAEIQGAADGNGE